MAYGAPLYAAGIAATVQGGVSYQQHQTAKKAEKRQIQAQQQAVDAALSQQRAEGQQAAEINQEQIDADAILAEELRRMKPKPAPGAPGQTTLLGE